MHQPLQRFKNPFVAGCFEPTAAKAALNFVPMGHISDTPLPGKLVTPWIFLGFHSVLCTLYFFTHHFYPLYAPTPRLRRAAL